MFSADGPDPGSQLLVDQFDNAISGEVADFGAGWGYLGTELLKRCNNIKVLDSYEAHWPSLLAAEENIKRADTGTVSNFHWFDLTTEVVTRSYDWIVMNPPFHVSRASDHEIGSSFIRAAAKALKRGGRLLIVANRELPYEKVLETNFSEFVSLEENKRFKIFRAAHPKAKKGNT